MEFKVIKNETGKILKEYWVTPSEWDALDKTTVQEGDIYHIVGTLDKGDLSADVNASLSKADSSLQKPTATLAKESFVKVGIDGTEKFDDSSYANLSAQNYFNEENTFTKPAHFFDDVNIMQGKSLKLSENSDIKYGDSTSGTAYKFRNNSQENVIATLGDLIEDDTKTYITFNGVSFPSDTSSSFVFDVPQNAVIDWGDGTIQSFTTATSKVTHTYPKKDVYRITISGLTQISNGAFDDCVEILDVKLGSIITYIGGAAFKGTSISHITIPVAVQDMQLGNIFANCSNLKTVKLLSETPLSTQSSIFTDSPIEKIIVPKSAVNAYKTAAGWSTYADKIVYETDSADLLDYVKNSDLKDLVNGQLVTTTALIPEKSTMYLIQCFKSDGNLADFTVRGVDKSVTGRFALVIVGDHIGSDGVYNSLALVQTGSILISELAKTVGAITSITPSSGNRLGYYKLSGKAFAINSDTTTATSVEEIPDDLSITEFLYQGDFGTGAQVGSCTFYWGDGTSTTYANGDIPEHTYSDGVSLHKISIEGLTSLPDNLFTEQTNLYGITLGNTTTVDMACFSGCDNLKTIRIKETANNELPITFNDLSSFYHLDLVNFKIIIPRSLYNGIIDTGGSVITDFIWHFVVPDDGYVCSHSVQLEGNDGYIYEVMIYAGCKVPFDISMDTAVPDKLLRPFVNGEIAYRYDSSGALEGFGSLTTDSDGRYQISFCHIDGGGKTEETFVPNSIIDDIVKLK